MIYLHVLEPRARGSMSGGQRGGFLSARLSVAGSLAALFGVIVILTLGSSAFAQEGPCYGQGSDCRLLTPAEINEVHFVYDGLVKPAAKTKDTKDSLARVEQMQAAVGNRVEVLAKLLPHAYLVDNVDIVTIPGILPYTLVYLPILSIPSAGFHGRKSVEGPPFGGWRSGSFGSEAPLRGQAVASPYS